MTTFTITITPDDESLATTSVRVDASAPTVVITELLIKAAAGKGLTATQLPAVNLDLLLRAVTPAVLTTPAAAEPVVPIPAEAATGRRAPRKRAAPTPPVAVAVAVAEKQPRDRAAAPVEKPRRIRAKAPAAKSPVAPEPATAPVAAEENGRVYRRMPADLAEVFAQAGSIIGVADHYDVPRHTAQNWIKRARTQGTIPAR